MAKRMTDEASADKKIKKEKKTAPKKSKAKNKTLRMIIMIAAILVMAVGTVVLTKYVIWPRYRVMKAERTAKKEQEAKEAKKEMGLLYSLDDITVNTYGSNGYRYVVAGLTFETHDEQVIEELEKRDPQVKDGLNNYFRGKSASEINKYEFQDSARVQIERLVNKILTVGEIDTVYIVKLIIQ